MDMKKREWGKKEEEGEEKRVVREDSNLELIYFCLMFMSKFSSYGQKLDIKVYKWPSLPNL